MLLVYSDNQPTHEAVKRFSWCWQLPADTPEQADAMRGELTGVFCNSFDAHAVRTLRKLHRESPGTFTVVPNAPPALPRSQRPPRPQRRPIAGDRASEFAPESVTRLARKLARVVRDRAISFVRAVTGPRVPSDVADARLKQCISNECGYLREHDGKHYCGACGCPRWKLAELRNKVTYAKLACPCEPPYWGEYES